MRPSRPLLAAFTAAVIVASTVAVAGAFISSASSIVIMLSPAPPSVALNALENPTKVFAFDEKQRVTLTSAVKIDYAAPGVYTQFPGGTATIPVGTLVDSHFIHSDVPKGSYTRGRTGSVTFDTDIIGIVASTGRLAASDAQLGATGTTYAGTTQYRGLESTESGSSGADKLTISADHRTVSFEFATLKIDNVRIITQHRDQLSTTITDSPDPVTAGNDVQYTLTVTNDGTALVPDAHVIDTLPPGTTLVVASASGGCSGTGPVNCALGALGVGASAQAQLVVTSPSVVPVGGTITDSAIASPGANVAANEVTTVEASEPGVSKGFVLPGDSITIPGDDPATVTLPETGSGSPIIITQGDGTFCSGPCAGPATEISPFPGYDDPNNPIHLTLTYNFPSGPNSLTDAASAFGSIIYKNDDPLHPEVGTVVPFCTTVGGGVAIPHPCIDAHSITQPTFNSFVVTFEILYISGDPRFARH